jgi:hypothetical protein
MLVIRTERDRHSRDAVQAGYQNQAAARQSRDCHRLRVRFEHLIAILAIVAAENQSYKQ